MSLKKKISKLKKIILNYDSLLVAFSGGADSTFLLKVALSVLPKDKILAVTATSATYPKEELEFSKNIASLLGVRHKVIQTFEFQDKQFIANSPQRCYFCKKELFSRLRNIARQANLNFIADASNISDTKDFRPGNKAKEEFRVRSPLQEAGFTKEDIRLASKIMRLSTWDKPSLACLASRIPYGTAISKEVLKRINASEGFLIKLGFRQVRVRHYNDLCRIEVFKSDIPAFIRKRRLIVEKLKELGYNYITLDLEGYRTGSLNEVIKR